jgi:hypothetical protein
MLRDIVLHDRSNLSTVAHLMGFKASRHGKLSEAVRAIHLPSQADLSHMQEILQRSSCAVVAASAALLGCEDAHDICRHDIVIHVNEHPRVLSLCPRVDVQIVNAFACVEACAVHPTLFRLRHEWNPRRIVRYSNRAWLATGVGGTYVRKVLTDRTRDGRCCPSAGGIATSFAMDMCKRTTLFGVGAQNASYIDDPHKTAASGSVHDFAGEFRWYLFLKKYGHVDMRCY